MGQLSGGCLSWRELFEANCPAGKSLEDNYPWGKFDGVIVWRDCVTGGIIQGQLSGGQKSWE